MKNAGDGICEVSWLSWLPGCPDADPEEITVPDFQVIPDSEINDSEVAIGIVTNDESPDASRFCGELQEQEQEQGNWAWGIAVSIYEYLAEEFKPTGVIENSDSSSFLLIDINHPFDAPGL